MTNRIKERVAPTNAINPSAAEQFQHFLASWVWKDFSKRWLDGDEGWTAVEGARGGIYLSPPGRGTILLVQPMGGPAYVKGSQFGVYRFEDPIDALDGQAEGRDYAKVGTYVTPEGAFEIVSDLMRTIR